MFETLSRLITAYRTAFHFSPTAGRVLSPAPTVELNAHDSLHLRAQMGQRLMCLAGSLWITQDGDRRDVILGPGQIHQFDRTGPALIQAWEHARFSADVCEPNGGAHAPRVAVCDPGS